MDEAPDSKLYEQGLEYWPYITSWNKVLDYISQNAPEDGTMVDLMCGPGHLIGKIASIRKDLNLKGVDIDKRYISHAKKAYPKIDFELADILSWEPEEQQDIIICTGALHHIPYDQQENAVERMASIVKPEGFVLISDSYLDDYSNATERKIAAAKLGFEYLKATIQNGAPESVIEATIQILWNDVLMKEFKTSMKKRLPIFEKFFNNIETSKTWPTFESEYGDHITICRKK